MILNYKVTGKGLVVLLLHGMAGSLRYWDDYVAKLSGQFTVIVVDLMGFGHSPKSSGGYTTEQHAQAIHETLDALNVSGPACVIGNSMGALIGLRYATLYSSQVTRLVLISLPIYCGATEAKAEITQGKTRLRLTYYGITSRVLCAIWCHALRPISRHIAPLYLRSLPKHVAQDSLLHSWTAYSQSLKHVIEHQQVVTNLRQLNKIPTELMYGTKDSPVVLRNLKSLLAGLNRQVSLTILDGTHNLALEQVDEITNLIVSPSLSAQNSRAI